MALKPCKSCNHKIDTTVKICPNCGVKKPGVTLGQQIGGLVILALIVGVAVSMFSDGREEKPLDKTTHGTIPKAYAITTDDFREGRPRKVEVLLPKRISDAELVKVAKAVHDDTKVKAKTTFIGFRVEGQTDKAYWANASFTPQFSSSLIGLSAQDYQDLMLLDLKAYPDSVGSWLSDGALGHMKVLYKRNGKYLIDSIFPRGEKNTKNYQVQALPDGGLRLEEPENDFNEYYIIDAKGNLQGWGENGIYMTLPAHKSNI